MQGTSAIGAIVLECLDDEKPGDGPGVAVGITAREAVSTYVRGMAGVGGDVPLRSDSVFNLCSITKQFVGLLVAMLTQRRVFGLNERVRRYLPELPDVVDDVRVSHLLYHTSGIRDYIGLIQLAGRDPGTLTTTKETFDLIAGQKAANFGPGTRHLYSNSGYFLLARIIERATRENVGNILREEVFVPLGMNKTVVRERNEDDIPPGYVWGHVPDGSGLRRCLGWREYIGAGGVSSNVEDLVRWEQGLCNRDGSRWPARMRRRIERCGRAAGRSVGYGFGIYVRGIGRDKHHYHIGGADGYRHAFIRFPRMPLSVVVLGNSACYDSYGLARRITNRVLGRAPREGSVACVVNDAERGSAVPRAERVARAREYGGAYYQSEELGTVCRACTENDELVLRGRPVAMRFEAGGGDGFVGEGMWLQGERDERGRVCGFLLSSHYARGVRFRRC